MKKRIQNTVLVLCMVLSLLPLTPITTTATTTATEGYATVTLVSQCDWGDDSGYQMLLDSTATAYGIRFGSIGALAMRKDSTEEVYSAFDYKIPADAGWTRDTEAVVRYGSSQTIEIPAGIYDFCITNPTPGDSIWIASINGDDVGRADDFEFKAGMHYTFTTSKFGYYDGVTLTVTDRPVISGLTDGKTYCSAQIVTASDDDGIASVTVNGNPVTLTNGQFTLLPAEGTQTVVVTDKAGNTTEITVTVNYGHTGGTADCTHKAKCEVCGEEYGEVNANKHTDEKEWTTKNETQHEQKRKCCGAVEVALEKHEWEDGVCTECGYVCVHTGGTADCTHKAKCEYCDEEYGEVNADNHTTLKHTEAKAATVETEGNIEYWHCEECGKYFADANGENEIALADTVVGKAPEVIPPQTGDNSRTALWITLFFVSGGALVGTAIYGKKKKLFAK